MEEPSTFMTYWHWLAIASVFAVLELILPGSAMLWFAGGAAAAAMVVWLSPDLAWQIQFLLFAGLGLVGLVATRFYFKRRPISSDRPNLNRRGAQYIGEIVILTEAIINGHGRASIGDSEWAVSGPDMPKGSRVKIIAADGADLKVEPAA